MEDKKAEKNGKTTVKELLEIAERLVYREYDNRTDCTGHFTDFYSQGFCDGLEYMYDLLKEETK